MKLVLISNRIPIRLEYSNECIYGNIAINEKDKEEMEEEIEELLKGNNVLAELRICNC